ncbi:S-phase kinase-associated protein 1-like [Trichogramma pretiosum]|uniref:S-phase kinase-associated protein 1-like n=1 Tax=Trichogramma pretiosum TaxID=7493 RepID=UPI0006C968F5|nr:S-phase kinase-associated protein 1-like [Trichogramma pretiosum]
MKTIKLESADGKKFEVDIEVAKCSITIKTMLDLHAALVDIDNEAIPLPNVNGDILKLFIEWATHHVKEEEDAVKITPWEQKFLKDHDSQLRELIMAANYLDVKRLLDITCFAVAQQIKGKSPDKIKKRLEALVDVED